MKNNIQTDLLFASSPQPSQLQPGGVGSHAAMPAAAPLKYDLTPYEPAKHPTIIKRQQRTVSWPVKLAGVFSACALLLTVGFAWHTYAQVSQVFQGKVVATTQTPTSNTSVQLLAGEDQGRIHVLVMGTAGAKHRASDLTDMMAIMSIDVMTHAITMLPLPKNLSVTMPNQYFGPVQALNTVYASGKYSYLGKAAYTRNDPETVQAGFAAVDKVVQEVTGIKVDCNIVVNFESFGSAVDAIGGVTVKHPQRYYDASMATEYGNKPLAIPAGTQILDGKKAMQYARSMQGGEDARVQRQLQLVQSFMQQLTTMERASQVSVIPKLFHSLSANLRTDLSLEAARRLFTISTSGDTNSTIQIVSLASLLQSDQNSTNPLLQPKLGAGQYQQLQAYIQTKLPGDNVRREQAKVVMAGSERGATDMRLQQIKSAGVTATTQPYSVSRPRVSQPTLVDVTGNRAPYTKQYLLEQYGATEQPTLPADLLVPDGVDFVILP